MRYEILVFRKEIKDKRKKIISLLLNQAEIKFHHYTNSYLITQISYQKTFYSQLTIQHSQLVYGFI